MRGFIYHNKLIISIILFLILFMIIHYIKPGILYTKEGGFRQFGLGYRHKTVIPIWVVAISLSIFCYLMVICYLAYF
jgi:hypothetical protein